jgi:hypothetical protein
MSIIAVFIPRCHLLHHLGLGEVTVMYGPLIGQLSLNWTKDAKSLANLLKQERAGVRADLCPRKIDHD